MTPKEKKAFEKDLQTLSDLKAESKEVQARCQEFAEKHAKELFTEGNSLILGNCELKKAVSKKLKARTLTPVEISNLLTFMIDGKAAFKASASNLQSLFGLSTFENVLERNGKELKEKFGIEGITEIEKISIRA